MAGFGIIRRWCIRVAVREEKLPHQRDISRDTVRRYIRSNAIEPWYPAKAAQAPLICSQLDSLLGHLKDIKFIVLRNPSCF